MLFLCAKVNHGHSLFGHRILSEKKIKDPKKATFTKNQPGFWASYEPESPPKKNKTEVTEGKKGNV